MLHRRADNDRFPDGRSDCGPCYIIQDVSLNLLQTIRKNFLCVALVFAHISMRLILMHIEGTTYGPVGLIVFKGSPSSRSAL
jgi:hypothetical protein